MTVFQVIFAVLLIIANGQEINIEYDSVPICQCDSRGTQINDYDGDWCWLKESPCELLTATIVNVSFTWVPCENKYGANQIECKETGIKLPRPSSNVSANSSMNKTTTASTTLTTMTTTNVGTFQYKCKRGYCTPSYGNTIYGKSDDVANACSRDHPRCKAFQYSSDNGLGHLCSSIDDGGISGSYQNCRKIENTLSEETSNGWINGFCNDTIDTKKNRESRKELGPECGSDCPKPKCLNLCKNYDWFACEYHQDSHNCVAVLGLVDPENTIVPPLNEEQGFCYLNRKFK